MKYYKVEALAFDVTIPDKEPQLTCILIYRHLTSLTESQLEKKVKQDFNKIPELIYNKCLHFAEISDEEFTRLQQSRTTHIFRPYDSFRQYGPLQL